jgi:hypothetical protein
VRQRGAGGQYALALAHLSVADRLIVVSPTDFDRLTALGQAVIAGRAGN